MAEILLIRHGQTEWSANGRHTSTTDLPLTAHGEEQARALAPGLADRKFVAVLSSPRTRALRTAELAGLDVTDVDDDLVEWDYGRYEGRTTADIHTDDPDWNLWTDGAPGGESPRRVAERLDRATATSRSSRTATRCASPAPAGSASPPPAAACCGSTPGRCPRSASNTAGPSSTAGTRPSSRPTSPSSTRTPP
jgi:hypothetical protein